jgi:DNA polymerase II small subunit
LAQDDGKEKAGKVEGEVAARVQAADLLIQPEAARLLAAKPNALELVEKAIAGAQKRNEFVIARSSVEKLLEEESQKAMEVVIVRSESFKPKAREVEAKLSFLEEYDVSGKSRCTGSVEDFTSHFRDRYRRIAALLKARASESGITRLSALASLAHGRNARIIGMVSSKRPTKKGHVIIEVEDEEGGATCLVPASGPARSAADQIVLDEVVALDGYASEPFFIVKNIVWPEMPIRQKKLAEEDVAIAFLSDLHVGSRFFMRETFEKFLRFLNGDCSSEEQEVAGKIKYLLVAGDLTDGIGVYPRQERELVTKDIYTQYEIFAEYIRNVPEWIEVVIGPGNHDAVRIADPQPRLPEEFVKSLAGYRNIHFVGSPSVFDVHGLRCLMYHGNSIDALVNACPGLSAGYQSPERIGVELLKRRHLSPIYGEEPIAPEAHDYLVVDEPPDIFHFGHAHHNGSTDYRGTRIINSGTWQSTTDYQVKRGHVPTPCQLPIYNLKAGALNILKFGAE